MQKVFSHYTALKRNARDLRREENINRRGGGENSSCSPTVKPIYGVGDAFGSTVPLSVVISTSAFHYSIEEEEKEKLENSSQRSMTFEIQNCSLMGFNMVQDASIRCIHVMNTDLYRGRR
jgi:hypothetical protein